MVAHCSSLRWRRRARRRFEAVVEGSLAEGSLEVDISEPFCEEEMGFDGLGTCRVGGVQREAAEMDPAVVKVFRGVGEVGVGD